MQAESSLSRQASESGGAESEPSTLTQGDTSTSAGQEAADAPRAEQVGVKLPLWVYTGHHRYLPAASPPPTEQNNAMLLLVLTYQLQMQH